jgi:phospholipid/cholesterol/gamma-HCH transport system substrate-binding protein
VRTRGLGLRLVTLVVVGLAAFAYITFDVVRWRVGAQDFPVTVVLPRAGGIYPEAVVTFRGVTVGRVTALHLTPAEVDVDLEVAPGTHIPADASASVRELTAAGEQYLDLVPRTGDPPYLHPGSVIRANVSVPVAVGTVLADTGSLLQSLDPADVRTIDQALATGLGGAGGDLREIVVAGQTVIGALEQSEPATVQLIVGGQTVLGFLDATNGALSQFSRSLDQLSAQLKASNSDIVALLANGVASAGQVNRLLSQYSGSFQGAIDNLATVGNVGDAQQQAMQALFQVLPVFAGRIGATASNGRINVQLYVNSTSPVCTYGSGQLSEPTQSTGAPDLGRGCANPAPGSLVRGASNAPRPG